MRYADDYLRHAHCYLIRDPDRDLLTDRIAADLRLFLSQVSVPLEGPERTGEPILGPDRIAFNGNGDQACDPFEYPPRFRSPLSSGEADLDGCDTERRPYDVAVCAALLTIKYHLQDDIDISPAGQPDDLLWRLAIDQYDQVFPDRNTPELVSELLWE